MGQYFVERELILSLNKRRYLVLALCGILVICLPMVIEASSENDYFIELQNPYNETINSIGWVPNGSFALFICNKNFVLGYDGNNFTKLNVNTTRRLDDVSWNSSGDRALITGDGIILEYNLVNFTKVYETSGGTYQTAVAWRPNFNEALIIFNGYLLNYYNGNLSNLSSVGNAYSADIGWKSDGSSAIIALGNTLINYTENNAVMKSYVFSSSYVVGHLNITENRRFVFRSVQWIHNNTEVMVVGEIQIATIPQGSSDPIDYGFRIEPYTGKGVGENIDITKNLAAGTIPPSNGTDGILHISDWNDKNGGLIIGTFYTSYYPNPYYLQIYRLDTDGKLSVLRNDTLSLSSILPPPPSTLSWRPNTSTAIIALGDKILFYGRENSSIINKVYPDTNPTIFEYQPQTFSITPIGPTVIPPTISWFLDGAFVSNSTNYTLVSNYTSAGIYNITVNVSIGNISTSRSWNLTVLNVNRPPEITNYSVPPNLTFKEGENFTFNISAIDLDNQNLTYYWYLDTIIVSTNNTNYTFQTNYTSAGAYNITVAVSDGELNTMHSWNITVENVNLKPTATIAPLTSNTTKVGEETSLVGYGNDSDGVIVAYKWRTNDTILGTNSTLKISNLSVGKHTIYFKVLDNDGNWSDEVSATIEIKENEKVVEKKAFIPFASLNVVIFDILILALLIDLIRRRK